ncbi:hypothetical protein [Entomomonas asaccharolytica]|uniref:Uncharacterized protein n=1 Tax=Entomomonas asaccharolytica TaxID=2785331 RepID=A0A974NG55_9GAMM|nr:hypothetical protein [Entomomonas asaccharolytica]QQP86041.1 hypothetical protein JHT90_01945 [Entomomonas asaccharolytica]
MNDSILDGSGQPICSSESELAVQVTGIGHVANQLQKLAIRFYGRGDSKYSNCNEEINIGEEQIASTIFKWPEDVANSANQKQLVLEVPTKQGSKITLPVIDNLLTCGSQPDIYFLGNRLYSIMPLYHFGHYVDDEQKKYTQYYGAARLGYIYIFVGNTLWRELRVSRDQEGKNIFEDINLANFRDSNNHYKDSKRSPEGVELKDVWIPGSFYNNSTPKVRIAFSDVQWSGSRINYLQNNQAACEQRSIAIMQLEQNLLAQLESTKDQMAPKIQNNITPLVSLTLLPKTRARNEAVEFLIDHPPRYLITNNYISTHQQQTQTAIKSYLADQDTSRQFNLAPNLKSGFDTSAWQYNQLANKQPYVKPEQGVQPPANQRTIDEENIYNSLQEVWTDQTPFTDTLQEARSRGVLGVLIEDPNYQITHAKERIKFLTTAFISATQQAQQDPNFRIASLIEKQRKIVEDFEKGITKQMSATGRQLFDDAVAGPIRRELHRRVNHFKAGLRYELSTNYIQHYIADYFSNYDNPIDLIGHFAHIVETLNVMSLSMASYDPLLPIEAENDPTIFSGKTPSQVVQDITTDIKNPLHQMLYPSVEFNSLQDSYTPIAQTENKGDGQFNEGLWQTISNNDSILNQEPTTLNGAAISKIREQGDVLLTTGQFPNFKVMNAAIYSLIAQMADARKRAQDNILAQQTEYQTAQKELQAAEQELNVYKKDQQRVVNSQNIKLRDLEKHQTRIANAQKALQEIEQVFQNKLQQLGAIKARIPLKELQLLRITGGESFHNLQIKLETDIRINGSTSKRYYVLGNINHVPKPTVDVGRKFSLFDENVLFDKNTRGRRTDIYLVVMPDNDPYVVQRKQQLAQQIPELEADIRKSSYAVAHIEGQLLDLNDKHIITTRSVNNASTQVATSQSKELQTGTLFRQSEKTINSRINAIAQRIERSGRVPPVLLGLELINITIVTSSLSDTVRTRGGWRAGLGFGVALADTTMATIAVLETLQAQHKLFAEHTPIARGLKTLGDKNSFLVARGLSKAVNRMIPLGIFAIANTLLSAWDAYNAFKYGDGAVYGHIAFALAGGATVMSLLAGAGASVWLGPGGWIAASILFIAAGIVLLWKLADTELEQWFKQGPFGAQQNYPALKQSDEALAVLLNMVFQPDIGIEANPFQREAQNRLKEDSVTQLTPAQIAILSNVSKANTCIILNSALMGFANTDTVIRYACRLYQYRQETKTTKITTYIRTYTPISHEILHTEITPNGAIIFTHTPKASTHRSGHFNIYQIGYLWLGATQVVSEFVKTEDETLPRFYYFPAPPFTDKVQYNPAQDSQLSLTMPATDNGIVTVSGGGELTRWTQRLKQNFWKKLLIDGNNIL